MPDVEARPVANEKPFSSKPFVSVKRSTESISCLTSLGSPCRSGAEQGFFDSRMSRVCEETNEIGEAALGVSQTPCIFK